MPRNARKQGSTESTRTSSRRPARRHGVTARESPTTGLPHTRATHFLANIPLEILGEVCTSALYGYLGEVHSLNFCAGSQSPGAFGCPSSRSHGQVPQEVAHEPIIRLVLEAGKTERRGASSLPRPFIRARVCVSDVHQPLPRRSFASLSVQQSL